MERVMKKVIKDATGITTKAIKLGFVGLGFGLGVANRALGSALDGIKEGQSLSKREESGESSDSPPIDTTQPLEDVIDETYARWAQMKEQASQQYSFEEFKEQFHHLFHPDEMSPEEHLNLQENGETKEMYQGDKS